MDNIIDVRRRSRITGSQAEAAAASHEGNAEL